MTFAIRKFPGEPMVVVTVDFPLDRFLPNAHLISIQLDQLANNFTAPPLYTILDLSKLEPSVSDMLLLIDEFSKRTPGPLANPTLYPIVVGSHPIVGIGVKKIQQRLGVPVPWFNTLGE